MTNTENILNAMVSYYAGDVRRINHFLKVYGFAKLLGSLEELDRATQEILEIAALTHDIGIKNSELKYGSANGELQQIEGPPEAETLLASLSVAAPVIERVLWLIAHHHSYSGIVGIDYQILVEADFLVNIDEDRMPPETILRIREKIFRTASGLRIFDCLYPNAAS